VKERSHEHRPAVAAAARAGRPRRRPPAARAPVVQSPAPATTAPQPTAGPGADAAPPATPAAQPSSGSDLVVDGAETARIAGFADRDGQVVVRTNRIQLLTGDAANAYAAQQGLEVPVPNDQILVDDNPRLREYPVRADAPVTLTIPLSADPNGAPSTTTLAGLRELLAGRSDGDVHPFELVVEDGVVVEFRMLYRP